MNVTSGMPNKSGKAIATATLFLSAGNNLSPKLLIAGVGSYTYALIGIARIEDTCRTTLGRRERAAQTGTVAKGKVITSTAAMLKWIPTRSYPFLKFQKWLSDRTMNFPNPISTILKHLFMKTLQGTCHL
jgi:hypothetical protein